MSAGSLVSTSSFSRKIGAEAAFFGCSRTGTARRGCPQGRLHAQARFRGKSARGSRPPGAPGRARPAADVRRVACMHKLDHAGCWRAPRGLRHAPGFIYNICNFEPHPSGAVLSLIYALCSSARHGHSADRTRRHSVFLPCFPTRSFRGSAVFPAAALRRTQTPCRAPFRPRRTALRFPCTAWRQSRPPPRGRPYSCGA